MSSNLPIPRDLLDKYFGDDPRMVIAMTDLSQIVADASSPVGVVAAQAAMAAATVVVLSQDSGFANELVLSNGYGIVFDQDIGTLSIRVDPTLFVTTAAPVLKGNTIGNFANDAAAAAGGVPLWGVYRTGSALMIRST